MSVLEQLVGDLEAAPEDWKLRGVLADWFEDNGRPERAECLRWMVRQHKRPYGGYRLGKLAVACWFNADTISAGLGDPESDIPGTLFLLLEGGKAVANHRSFPSLRQAEEALQAAWVRARAQGWEPGG
jgi:uncharacterized protein (TIGR02996 family)